MLDKTEMRESQMNNINLNNLFAFARMLTGAGQGESLATAGSPTAGSKSYRGDRGAPGESGFHLRGSELLNSAQKVTPDILATFGELGIDMEILGRACQSINPKQGMYYADKAIPETPGQLRMTHTRPRDRAGDVQNEDLISFDAPGLLAGRRLFFSHVHEWGSMDQEFFTVLEKDDKGMIAPLVSLHAGREALGQMIAVKEGVNLDSVISQLRQAVDEGLLTTLRSGALSPGLASFFNVRLSENGATNGFLSERFDKMELPNGICLNGAFPKSPQGISEIQASVTTVRNLFRALSDKGESSFERSTEDWKVSYGATGAEFLTVESNNATSAIRVENREYFLTVKVDEYEIASIRPHHPDAEMGNPAITRKLLDTVAKAVEAVQP